MQSVPSLRDAGEPLPAAAICLSPWTDLTCTGESWETNATKDIRLAEQARAAGVDVTLEVWEGMQHEWHFAADMLPEGRQAIECIGQFIQDHLG